MIKGKKNKKLYACFVDFQKAFDSVWHEGMFRKLENLGINGNFLNLIKHIYKSMTCNVKIDNKCTQSFRYEKGVQQGNPLSPLLFNLFINDIFQAVSNNDMITIDNVNYFNTLMYADDLIILAPTHRALQKSLDGLYSYCEKWQLNINMKKTKCMTFAKGTNTKDKDFTLNGKPIQFTRTYKYLGIIINSMKCSFTAALEDLSCKAKKALYGLFSKLPIHITPLPTWIKLFDTCIAPILLYGSEIWGAYHNLDWKAWEQSAVEKVHTQFLKRLLGVNRSTTNAMVRAELGRHSLLEKITTRNLLYLQHVENKQEDDLIKMAAEYEEIGWSRPNLYSIREKYTSEDPEINLKTMSKHEINTYIKTYFNNEWKEYIETYPKARTYRTFKERVTPEDYLVSIRSRKSRVAMTKFRLSDHSLMIGKGRHSGMAEEDTVKIL